MPGSAPFVERRTRAPRGVVHEKRIGLGLKPDELAECEQFAAERNTTKAAFARCMYVRGVASYREERAAQLSGRDGKKA